MAEYITDEHGKWLVQKDGARALIEPSQAYLDRMAVATAVEETKRTDAELLALLDAKIMKELRLAKIAQLFADGKITAAQRDRGLEIIG